MLDAGGEAVAFDGFPLCGVVAEDQRGSVGGLTAHAAHRCELAIAVHAERGGGVR